MENKLERNEQNNFMDTFVKTDNVLNDMCNIIESQEKRHIKRLMLHLFKELVNRLSNCRGRT